MSLIWKYVYSSLIIFTASYICWLLMVQDDFDFNYAIK